MECSVADFYNDWLHQPTRLILMPTNEYEYLDKDCHFVRSSDHNKEFFEFFDLNDPELCAVSSIKIDSLNNINEWI